MISRQCSCCTLLDYHLSVTFPCGDINSPTHRHESRNNPEVKHLRSNPWRQVWEG